MPSDRYDLLGRVKAVEREHTALRFTTDYALKSLGPLLNRVASHVRFSGPILDNAHVVREYRNDLVHKLVHGIPDDQRMTIRKVTSHLCTFLSRALIP